MYRLITWAVNTVVVLALLSVGGIIGIVLAFYAIEFYVNHTPVATEQERVIYADK